MNRATDILFISFLTVFLLIPAVVGVAVAVDAGGQPTWAYERAGTSKTLWVVLPLAAFFACSIASVVVGVVWHASVRKRVVAARLVGESAMPK